MNGISKFMQEHPGVGIWFLPDNKNYACTIHLINYRDNEYAQFGVRYLSHDVLDELADDGFYGLLNNIRERGK